MTRNCDCRQILNRGSSATAIRRLVTVAISLLLAGFASAASAVPDYSDDTAKGGTDTPCSLTAVKHNFRGFTENLILSFEAGEKTASKTKTIPRYKVLYLELSSRLIITLQKTAANAKVPSFFTPLISSVEIRQDGDASEIHIRTRWPVRFAVSEKGGSLEISLADFEKTSYWLRIDAIYFTSPCAASRLRENMLREGVATFPIEKAPGIYAVACEERFKTLQEAEKKRKELQEKVDSIIARDLSMPFTATVSVDFDTGYDSAPQEALPALDARTDSLVNALSKDPVNLEADIKDKRLSNTCKKIVKLGRAAMPSLIKGAYSADENIRRSCLFILTQLPGPGRDAVLLDALEDGEAALRTELILCLSRQKMNRTLLPAFKAALSDEDKWVRLFAARTLARSCVSDGVRAMIDFIDDNETSDEAGEVLYAVTQKRFVEGGPGGVGGAKRKALAKEWLYWWRQEGAKTAFPAEPLPEKRLEARILAKLLDTPAADEIDDVSGIKKLRFHKIHMTDDRILAAAAIEDGSLTVGVLERVENGEPSLFWSEEIPSTKANRTARDARFFVFDADGDGANEFAVLIGGKRESGEIWTAIIYRPEKDRCVEIFRETLAEKIIENPDGLFKKHKSRHILLSFKKSAKGMPDITALKIEITGAGANAETSETEFEIKWNGKEYKMPESEEPKSNPAAPNNSPDDYKAKEKAPAAGTVDGLEIIVDKSDAVLLLVKNGKEIKRYPARFGAVGGGKEVEGDQKTPEGEYYICVKNPNSRYHLSMGISYPNTEDAKRGLKDGLITKEQHDKIVDAIKKGGIPPWKTKLGGEIFIHGDAETREKTLGCIALNNRDMEELYSLVKLGTKVVIQK